MKKSKIETSEKRNLKSKKNNQFVVREKNSDSNEKAEEFSCKFCSKKFSKRQQIGGHQSKAHPGMSDQYR